MSFSDVALQQKIKRLCEVESSVLPHLNPSFIDVQLSAVTVKHGGSFRTALKKESMEIEQIDTIGRNHNVRISETEVICVPLVDEIFPLLKGRKGRVKRKE